MFNNIIPENYAQEKYYAMESVLDFIEENFDDEFDYADWTYELYTEANMFRLIDYTGAYSLIKYINNPNKNFKLKHLVTALKKSGCNRLAVALDDVSHCTRIIREMDYTTFIRRFIRRETRSDYDLTKDFCDLYFSDDKACEPLLKSWFNSGKMRKDYRLNSDIELIYYINKDSLFYKVI